MYDVWPGMHDPGIHVCGGTTGATQALLGE